MAEGREEFERQLRELGYEPEPDQPPNRIVFPYTATGGPFEGQVVKIGLEVPPDFSRTPPPGPHVSPKILPINSSAPAHPDKVADSPFGPEWEYWSRPYQGWKGRESVATYMVYIDHLFRTIP